MKDPMIQLGIWADPKAEWRTVSVAQIEQTWDLLADLDDRVLEEKLPSSVAKATLQEARKMQTAFVATQQVASGQPTSQCTGIHPRCSPAASVQRPIQNVAQ